MGRLKWPTWFVVILATLSNVLALGVSILLHYFWLAPVTLGVTVAWLLLWLYSMRHRKQRVQYPLVPPQGKTDVYFPSSKIPRPIHEDFRKMEDSKRKLKKLRKMTRKRD